MTSKQSAVLWIGLFLIVANFWISGQSAIVWGDLTNKDGAGNGGTGKAAKPVPPPHSNTGPFGVPPGGPWFAYALTHKIQRQSNPALAFALANAGWIGFATKAEAQAFLDETFSKKVGNTANPGAQTTAKNKPAKHTTPGSTGGHN